MVNACDTAAECWWRLETVGIFSPQERTVISLYKLIIGAILHVKLEVHTSTARRTLSRMYIEFHQVDSTYYRKRQFCGRRKSIPLQSRPRSTSMSWQKIKRMTRNYKAGINSNPSTLRNKSIGIRHLKCISSFPRPNAVSF